MGASGRRDLDRCSDRLKGEIATRATGIFRLRFRSLFTRASVDQELDEELRYHLERQIEENTAAGMSRADARRAALQPMAGLKQRKEECRDTLGLNLIDKLWKDLRFAIR